MEVAVEKIGAAAVQEQQLPQVPPEVPLSISRNGGRRMRAALESGVAFR